MKFPRHFFGVAPVAVAAVLAGCFGGGPERDPSWPPTYPVEGKVLYNGEPVSGAVLAFRPIDSGKAASGRTSEDGSFSVVTTMSPSFTDRGAAVGDYKVTIVKTPASATVNPAATPAWDGPPTDEQVAAMTPSAADIQAEYAAKAKPGAELVPSDLPQKYASFDTTPLVLSVTAESNEKTFELID